MIGFLFSVLVCTSALGQEPVTASTPEVHAWPSTEHQKLVDQFKRQDAELISFFSETRLGMWTYGRDTFVFRIETPNWCSKHQCQHRSLAVHATEP